MIKDLVVNLTLGADRDPAAQFAVSIAATFQAHVAAIAFAYDPVIMPSVMDGLSATWIEAQRTENRAAAQEAIDLFEAASKREGLSAEHRIIEASLGKAASLFGRIARRFDLAVVGQIDPERTLPDDLLIEAALFESGRPMVDSLPFLKRGKFIEIIMVTGENGKADELPGVDLGEHLARHDLKVEVR